MDTKLGMIIKKLFKGIAGGKPHIDNIYRLGGRVPLAKALPFGMQHILAMLVSNWYVTVFAAPWQLFSDALPIRRTVRMSVLLP